jgi:ABC-type Fe3+-citrate transport system substrate-binding protein
MVEQGSSETLDSILNNLREFERDFKRLISQFQKIGDSSRLSGEVAEKFESAKKRLSSIQMEISNVVESVPASDAMTSTMSSAMTSTMSSAMTSVIGPTIIIRCKNWEDFKLQASNADNISFLYREEEKTFQVDAVKGSRVYTYSGQLPSGAAMLRTWLSKEVGTEASRVLEGVLALG